MDLRAGELHKLGLRVGLQEQRFQVLARLLAHPGDVVTREELKKKLWPADAFVDFVHGLITDLRQMSAVRVMSRTSVTPYKVRASRWAQIASELNVDAVVEGTALRAGNLVRITAQLIEAPADKHLWRFNLGVLLRPGFNPLRPDPRFQNRLRRIGYKR